MTSQNQDSLTILLNFPNDSIYEMTKLNKSILYIFL